MKQETTEQDPPQVETESQRCHALTTEPVARPSEELLHELRVHQIELEMQNKELRRAHVALEEVRDRYMDLYDFAPVGYLLLTREGLISEINLTAAGLLGSDRSKLLKRRFATFVTANDGDHWHLFFSGVMKHNERKNAELVLKRHDGTEFFGRLDCQCATSVDHDSTLRITLADITESKQAEAALREIEAHKLTEQLLKENETYQHAIFDATPDAMLISNEQGVITRTNRQAEYLLGYPVNELIGLSIEALLPERFRAGHPAMRAQFAASGVTRSMNAKTGLKALRKDGSEVDVEVSLSSIQTNLGLFYASALRDITERKRNDEELRIAATAFEGQEGMIVTDSNAVILRVNQAFTNLTGYSAAEAVGQTPRILSSGRHDKVFYQCMWDSINNKGYWQGEIWNRRKNGEIYVEWLSISAVKAPNHSISHYVASFSDITSNKEATAEIHRLAYYDPLTRLPNRRLLRERLQQAVATSTRSGMYGALLFIDLDNFKSLNDNHGHDQGDLLLQQVANLIATCVRDCDTVARLGGDEFVVMLEELSDKSPEAAVQTKTVGEKILAALNQPFLLAGREHHSTPSIGATLFSNHARNIDEPLKQADIAMYQAKAAGRNTLRFFDQGMQAAVTERANLAEDLHRGLQDKQFLLYYQAQVDGEGCITGVESLVRWQHPRHGMVSPAKFIPLAEETGLILPLGRWVLETACAQLVTWATQPETAHLTIAVNVSAHQFRQADFVEQVLAVLDRTGADPHKLKLELTESLLVSDVEDIIAKMITLKAKGVGFSLDDFGTGYSSLSYLKRLPLDQLKIDQGFVRDILIDSNDAAIAKMIVALAESMGLEVIAEGVENKAQRDFLANLGCHTYQGYLFSRPLPLEAFDKFVKQR
jgi:diguanylate cyclase (GGDEF)-like protein/PAS domain S-box-containing protein